MSVDGTGEAVKAIVRRHRGRNKVNHRVDVIVNQKRMGALANLYHAIHSCEDDEIIVTVDGDDWLQHKNVLKDLNTLYSTQNIWLTHGRLIEYPNNVSAWCEPFPQHIIEKNDFRKFKCASHLRTFYAWLFKKIQIEDLQYEGDFFIMTWDMAMMYLMLEMAGERHAFVSNINYVYNTINPINDNKVNANYQNFLDRLIRNMPPYSRLDD